MLLRPLHTWILPGFCRDSAVSGMFAVRQIGPHDPGLFSSFIPEVAPRRWVLLLSILDLLPENARIGLNFIYFRRVCTSFICLGLLRIVSWTILTGGRDLENESCPRDHILPWTSFYIWPDLDFWTFGRWSCKYPGFLSFQDLPRSHCWNDGGDAREVL